MTTGTDATGTRRAVEAWARSGAMSLTGHADGAPLGPPARLPAVLSAHASIIERHAAANGRELTVDALALLAERAALTGCRRNGTTTCGGGGRLLAAADGWIAVNLARPDDIDLLPAWFASSFDTSPGDRWERVAVEVARRSTQELETGAALLGLPVGVVPPRPTGIPPIDPGPTIDVTASTVTMDPPPLVVDLSSLWAGPTAPGAATPGSTNCSTPGSAAWRSTSPIPTTAVDWSNS